MVNSIIDYDSSCIEQKLVNLGPLTPEITWHPKSILRVLRMLMHLSSGHVTLLLGEFQPPEFPPNWTYGAGWTHVWLCSKFLVVVVVVLIVVVFSSCETETSISFRNCYRLVVVVVVVVELQP